MDLSSEEPVFNYLWFHKCSFLSNCPLSHALVLGAGAFSAAKCLALDHPSAEVHTVDVEAELADIGYRFFQLDRLPFRRIRFHGKTVDQFFQANRCRFDFIFDDLFDGFAHVPEECRTAEHMGRIRESLTSGGVAIKNLIWDPRSQRSQAACKSTEESWRHEFASSGVVSLGDAARGHNLMLIGFSQDSSINWAEVPSKLCQAGIPASILSNCRFNL